MSLKNKSTDIICVGETLIDFIGTQTESPISETRDYHRYLGGSPTNVALNMSRLGMRVCMAATVGKDGFGSYILQRFTETKISTKYIKVLENNTTTVIFVNRTVNTPEFIPMRDADFHITEDQLPDDLLAETAIFHTSCFALSMEPARTTILKKALRAKALGCVLSIDANYSEKIWPDTNQAVQAIADYCALEPLVKVSQDDMNRLFGKGMNHDEIFVNLHGMGAKVVCLTLGNQGAKLSMKGAPVLELSAVKVEKIMDATGAGDAFWSGFLYSWIKGKSPANCMETALKMAAIKLQNVGRIPDYALHISNLIDGNSQEGSK